MVNGRRFFVLLLLSALPTSAWAATYYVAPDGKDSNPGSEAAPFATWGQAQTAAAPGDTVFFRGGRYRYTTASTTCAGSTSATVDSVVLSKSGTEGNPINYFAYPGEKPVFDFSGVTDTATYNCRHTGVRVTGSWLHLKGLELTGVLQLNNLNHESWCVYVYGGSNNVFEQLDAHHNMGPGFFLQRGGNNTFLNCDSHENEDPLTSNGDGQSADGFGCHPNRVGDTGNLFRGCRAWWNSDDGWDFINSTEACTVESSWSWYNGYKPDALSNGGPVSLAAGNGNGFKGGGYGMPPSNLPTPIPQHVIRFDVAFFNKAAGFYANHSPNAPVFYNNTSYKNGSADFDLLGVASDGSTSISTGLLRNNLAFAGTLVSNATLGGGLLDEQRNSWDVSLGITVASGDFQSVAFAPPASCPAPYKAGGTVCVPLSDTTSFAGMASARQADGSLPVLPFLRPAPGSQLVDKGQDIGFAFVGKAPDLGAFEVGATGGSSGSGGAGGAGGASTTGGKGGAGGSSLADGGAGTGATGGSGPGGSATGGAPAGGGGASTSPTTPGGSAGSGGRAGSGGVAVDAAGGAAGAGGTGQDAGSTGVGGQRGCSCSLGVGGRLDGGWAVLLVLAMLLAMLLARRRNTAFPRPKPPFQLHRAAREHAKLL